MGGGGDGREGYAVETKGKVRSEKTDEEDGKTKKKHEEEEMKEG